MKARSSTSFIPEAMGLRLFLYLACAMAVQAAEKAGTNAPPALPVITALRPIAIACGVTNKITLAGTNLTDVSAVQLVGLSIPITWKLVSAPKSDKSDKKGSGAVQEIEATVLLPNDAPLGTNVSFVVTNAAGASPPISIYVAAPGKLVEEINPNEGFKEAPTLMQGSSVFGNLSQSSDVDVYKVAVNSGQPLRMELIAARLGSSLDGSITLYNAKGEILGSNDDTAGRDPILSYIATTGGDYYIVVSGVTDLPAKTIAPYVLEVR